MPSGLLLLFSLIIYIFMRLLIPPYYPCNWHNQVFVFHFVTCVVGALLLLIYICMMNIKIKHIFLWILANWTFFFNKNDYSNLLPLSHTKLSAFTVVDDGYKYSDGLTSLNNSVFADYIFCCNGIFKLHLSMCLYYVLYLVWKALVVVAI